MSFGKSKPFTLFPTAAFCDAAGIVREIGPSAFVLPHLPAALAIRGSSHFMPFLVHRLSRECRSLDDLLSKIVSAALEVHISFPMTFGTLELWHDQNPTSTSSWWAGRKRVAVRRATLSPVTIAWWPAD